MNNSVEQFTILVAFLLFVAYSANGRAIDPTSGEPDAASTKPMISPLELQLVFPGSASHGLFNSHVNPPAGSQLVSLRSADGTKITGLFGEGTTPLGTVAKSRPTVMFFYGNGMCIADSLSIFNRFRGLGINTIVVDYEGYGMSDGSPSETGCYAAAEAAYEYLLTRNDVDPTRIVAAGWSLGAAVAIDLATRKSLAGVATFSAFTNVGDLVNTLAPDLPAAAFFSSKFDNLAKIGTISCPLFMVHGTRDTLVPPEMLDRLAKAAKTKPTVLRVTGASHNDLFLQGGDLLYRQVQRFVVALPPASPTTRPG